MNGEREQRETTRAQRRSRTGWRRVEGRLGFSSFTKRPLGVRRYENRFKNRAARKARRGNR